MTGVEKKKERAAAPSPRRRRLVRWGLALLAVVLVLLLARWLVQRSLSTPARKRAIQGWLDEHLNADVSILGDMSVRANFVPRIGLDNVEVDHPNPLFPGKFARVEYMSAKVPVWAAVRTWPGRLELGFRNLLLHIEQNEVGEWSHSGLLHPLAVGNTRLPFPIPRISGWRADVEESGLALRRRGYELWFDLDCRLSGRSDADVVALYADKIGFAFGALDSGDASVGTAAPVNIRVRLDKDAGYYPRPVAGGCAVKVLGLPVSTLPFFTPGIPMEQVPGVFHGVIRYDEHPDADGALFMDGELHDAPLAVFGLPRTAPFRLTWPFGSTRPKSTARLHMGPSGFGAFDIDVELDERGAPTLLSMRGDVAALDDIPSFFSRYSRWPDWLSRTFPRIRWQTGTWRGFGWNGENLSLELSRSMAGLNLTGEGEMMGGRVRVAVTPDQPDAPVTLAAERLSPERMSAKLSQFLPGAFRAAVTGSNVSFSWRGFPGAEGEHLEWGTGMVWVKPTVNLSQSGAFWQCMSGIARAIADALPEWGGGEAGGIIEVGDEKGIAFDQLSVVTEKSADGSMGVEFRAYGASFGQVTGLIERFRGGAVEGEFLLAGSSRLLQAVSSANSSFATTLDLLANDSPGLRVAFRMDPAGSLEFSYPFIDDARRIRDELGKNAGAARGVWSRP